MAAVPTYAQPYARLAEQNALRGSTVEPGNLPDPRPIQVGDALKYTCKPHEEENKMWHARYPDDLEDAEVVPFNASRDCSYWWVPTEDGRGKSRWRSKKQLRAMNAYLSSSEYLKDYETFCAGMV